MDPTAAPSSSTGSSGRCRGSWPSSRTATRSTPRQRRCDQRASRWRGPVGRRSSIDRQTRQTQLQEQLADRPASAALDRGRHPGHARRGVGRRRQTWSTLHARRIDVEVFGLGKLLDDVPELGFIQGTAATETVGAEDPPGPRPRGDVRLGRVEPGGPQARPPRPAREPTRRCDRSGRRARHRGRRAGDGDATGASGQLVVTNQVAPGTLPRLRYGRSYAFRAWAVDLAGNSRPHALGPAPSPSPSFTSAVASMLASVGQPTLGAHLAAPLRGVAARRARRRAHGRTGRRGRPGAALDPRRDRHGSRSILGRLHERRAGRPGAGPGRRAGVDRRPGVPRRSSPTRRRSSSPTRASSTRRGQRGARRARCWSTCSARSWRSRPTRSARCARSCDGTRWHRRRSWPGTASPPASRCARSSFAPASPRTSTRSRSRSRRPPTTPPTTARSATGSGPNATSLRPRRARSRPSCTASSTTPSGRPILRSIASWPPSRCREAGSFFDLAVPRLDDPVGDRPAARGHPRARRRPCRRSSRRRCPLAARRGAGARPVRRPRRRRAAPAVPARRAGARDLARVPGGRAGTGPSATRSASRASPRATLGEWPARQPFRLVLGGGGELGRAGSTATCSRIDLPPGDSPAVPPVVVARPRTTSHRFGLWRSLPAIIRDDRGHRRGRRRRLAVGVHPVRRRDAGARRPAAARGAAPDRAPAGAPARGFGRGRPERCRRRARAEHRLADVGGPLDRLRRRPLAARPGGPRGAGGGLHDARSTSSRTSPCWPRSTSRWSCRRSDRCGSTRRVHRHRRHQAPR